MDNVLAATRRTNAGIVFSVVVEFQEYRCLVPRATLSYLSHSIDPKLDLLGTYRAFQTKIEGVARRLIGAGIVGKPLIISSDYFQ